MVSVLLAFLLACTPQPPEPRPAAPNSAQRAKAAKAQAVRAARAKAMKARAAKAGGGMGGAGGGAGARVGTAGPMVGEVVYTQVGEGEMLKTRAQLRLQWEGGQQAALLGETSGTCVAAEPRAVASGQTATWWSTCTWKDMVADYAILIAGPMVVVQRQITKDDKASEWITVRRVHLVDGGQITPGKVTVAFPEGGAAGNPTPAAPAPAAAPAAPAPAAPAPAPVAPAPVAAPAPAPVAP